MSYQLRARTVRELDVTNDISMSIHTSLGSKLSGESIFMVPYGKKIPVGSSTQTQERYHVLYGGFIPFLKVNKDGVFFNDCTTLLKAIDDCELSSVNDEQRMDTWSLALLALSSKEAPTPVYVDNPKSLPLDAVTDYIVTAYASLFIRENIHPLLEWKSEAKAEAMQLFNPDTPEGRRRRVYGSTVTAYYGTREHSHALQVLINAEIKSRKINRDQILREANIPNLTIIDTDSVKVL